MGTASSAMSRRGRVRVNGEEVTDQELVLFGAGGGALELKGVDGRPN